MSEKTYYTILPAKIRYDQRLIASEKILFSEILTLANKKGYCHASNSYFSKLYGVSVITVSKRVSSLVSLGFLKSKLIYEKNSRKIKQRNLYISKSLYEKLGHEGIKEELKGDIEVDFKDNNININNTSNNRSIILKIISTWNKLGGLVEKISYGKLDDKGKKSLAKLIGIFSQKEIIGTINLIGESDYLLGLVSGKPINFNWFIRKDNFIKVKNGFYTNKKNSPTYKLDNIDDEDFDIKSLDKIYLGGLDG